jgi:hypothetical protein
MKCYIIVSYLWKQDSFYFVLRLIFSYERFWKVTSFTHTFARRMGKSSCSDNVIKKKSRRDQFFMSFMNIHVHRHNTGLPNLVDKYTGNYSLLKQQQRNKSCMYIFGGFKQRQ